MAAADAKRSSKKRKAAPEEEAPAPPPAAFPHDVGLEMGSEDEGEDGEDVSDDGEVDVFPEIDARSDTDDEDYVEDGEDDSEESDEEEDEDEDEDAEEEESSDEASDDDLRIFPKAKTVISDITGQPKRVYPEIEPDYDSDSSTEDVRKLTLPRMLRLAFVDICSVLHRHPTASGTSQCIGTTIYHM